MLSTSVFDNSGKPYDVSRILTSDFLFDEQAYKGYSKVYLPITYALSYGIQFAGLAALISHTICWHGKDIWNQTMRSFIETSNSSRATYRALNTDDASSSSSSTRNNIDGRQDSSSKERLDDSMTAEDVHNRLMARYEDAPLSWYLLTLVAMLAIGILVVEYYPTHLPWYGLLLALSISAVLFIPVGIVMAITNQQSSLYIICQLICGVIFPGRPVANMVFVSYGYIGSAQGIKFSSDLKLGHYMKIPPKLLFKVQMAATLVSNFTQIGVLNWMFANMKSLCTLEAINGFTCPIARVHFNGSILWGVIGPKRFFGPGALYRPLLWGFLAGALAPVVIWMIGRRKTARGVWRKINLPVTFGSLSFIPPAVRVPFRSLLFPYRHESKILIRMLFHHVKRPASISRSGPSSASCSTGSFAAVHLPGGENIP